jgi:hypothetical protein
MSTAVPSGWDRRRNLLLGKYERIALEMFASRGFRAVTVDEIADAAGYAESGLRRYSTQWPRTAPGPSASMRRRIRGRARINPALLPYSVS